MKKSFIVVLCLCFLGIVVIPGFAGSYDREDADEAGYVESRSGQQDFAVTSGPAYVHAVTVFANAASSYVNLHDNTSASDPSKIKVEVGEATQYETTRVVFDPPVKFDTAIYADVTSGSVVVEYR